MFNKISMLAGGTVGVYLAVAAGAPPPSVLISHVKAQAAQILQVSQVSHVSQAGGDRPGHRARAGCADGGWGTGSRAAAGRPGPASARVIAVGAGRHGCFDRLVVALGPGARPGYQVRYVRSVDAAGTGRPISLRGGARLEIIVSGRAAAGFPAAGGALAGVSGLRSVRQVAGAGARAGRTDIGVGVRTRLPFRAFVLPGPGRDARLVIDVAHHR
jgi:hypothetical protein